MRSDVTVDPGADVHAGAALGSGTVVWGGAAVREGARVGSECIIGRGAYVDAGVTLGDRVKVQNLALIYAPAVVEDDAFIGPAVILTNDLYPRSVGPDDRLKRAGDWQAAAVTVRTGASIGARAVVVAGVSVGRYALVGAGAVVTRDVPDFALVVGVPARRTGWVGHAGVRLVAQPDQQWACPETGRVYRQVDDRTLVELRRD
jgi:UDP-2-acetamido-3-amino-2,3-dideoxy-glucuronate N-acetyltransferase